MGHFGQLFIFVAKLATVAILLTGSRGQTRTDDRHRMKVLHWPLCYSTANLLYNISKSGLPLNLNVANNRSDLGCLIP